MADPFPGFQSNQGRLASAARAERYVVVMIVTECLPPLGRIVGRSSRA
jgi:hypothetical protein